MGVVAFADLLRAHMDVGCLRSLPLHKIFSANEPGKVAWDIVSAIVQVDPFFKKQDALKALVDFGRGCLQWQVEEVELKNWAKEELLALKVLATREVRYAKNPQITGKRMGSQRATVLQTARRRLLRRTSTRSTGQREEGEPVLPVDVEDSLATSSSSGAASSAKPSRATSSGATSSVPASSRATPLSSVWALYGLSEGPKGEAVERPKEQMVVDLDAISISSNEPEKVPEKVEKTEGKVGGRRYFDAGLGVEVVLRPDGQVEPLSSPLKPKPKGKGKAKAKAKASAKAKAKGKAQAKAKAKAKAKALGATGSDAESIKEPSSPTHSPPPPKMGGGRGGGRGACLFFEGWHPGEPSAANAAEARRVLQVQAGGRLHALLLERA
jgi:hypothetical protein